ncbi:6-phosphogluconolactonase [Tribolium castaneum]|uniref:6-phosphogluconolactonase n=1 Tax=Tribolium castaneum TaxID=7070 RepID=D6WWZ6_TRICA|nr:PREDICTED: 6-phosphogluconolactonase [Tribolium castaneum]EFA08071.1 putative 6-phosphogluconolactonase-like Protein [Tribolium castaneum]|eukprot:XP_968770.1 PREDICTED: 6-phosphogluconolactonase [Tribolium castaneum]
MSVPTLDKSVNIVKNRDQVVTTLASLIEQVSNDRIQKHSVFNIGVSGGSLVAFLKEGLPKIQTDFGKWRIFFCDERVVPEDSPDSTYGQYKQLISALNLKENQFVTIKQGVSAQEAAEDYVRKVAQQFPQDAIPKFDMLLLGMGPDGHTCSLFPGHKLLEERSKWVAAITDSPKPPPSRVTLTFPVINNALYCVFALCGKEKADMVKRILVDGEDLPATRVKPNGGTLVWIMDEEAGKYLK